MGQTLPTGVTSIGYNAFYHCTGLTSVTIPASVTSIDDHAFYWCTGLTKASFTGNAPAMGENAFQATAGGFTVYFFADKMGFAGPPWNYYAAVNMGTATPIVTWLVEKGLPYNAELNSDPNGDGVNLLMAYALNLDPWQNLAGNMPKPVMSANQMRLDFYAGSAGVTYIGETSTDLQHWTIDGVTLSGPDANKVRTATVNKSVQQGYLRLVVMVAP